MFARFFVVVPIVDLSRCLEAVDGELVLSYVTRAALIILVHAVRLASFVGHCVWQDLRIGVRCLVLSFGAFRALLLLLLLFLLLLLLYFGSCAVSLLVFLVFFFCERSTSPPGGNQVDGLPPALSGAGFAIRGITELQFGAPVDPFHMHLVLSQLHFVVLVEVKI